MCWTPAEAANFSHAGKHFLLAEISVRYRGVPLTALHDRCESQRLWHQCLQYCGYLQADMHAQVRHTS